MPKEILNQIANLQEAFTTQTQLDNPHSYRTFIDLARNVKDELYFIKQEMTSAGHSLELIARYGRASNLLHQASRGLVTETLRQMKMSPHPSWGRLVGDTDRRRLSFLASDYNGSLELNIEGELYTPRITIKYPLRGFNIDGDGVTLTEVADNFDDSRHIERLSFKSRGERITQVNIRTYLQDPEEPNLPSLEEESYLNFSYWADYHRFGYHPR